MQQAGKMRHRIDVEVPPSPDDATVQDKYGQPRDVWTPESTRWCNIVPLSGRELQQAQQTFGDVSHRVEMYYYSGLAPDQNPTAKRLNKDGRIFNISAVLNPDETKADMHVFCVEEV